MSPTAKIGFKYVRKRDGRLAPFDKSRIANAIMKAMKVTGEGDEESAEKVVNTVVQGLFEKHMKGGFLPPDAIPNIEEIQDLVETNLILLDYPKTAKAYILYRNERAKLREKRREIPEHVKKLAAESKKYFRNPLAEFVYYRSYSRWIEKEGRRETWIETVDRFMNFMKEKISNKLSEKEYGEIRESILKQEVMPSMRLMWSAGEAARKSNVAAYNCSFIAPRKLRDFAEIMYISMCGTGVGFSVEHQNVHSLPQIKRQTNHKKISVHAIDDSKEGWAEAFYLGLKTWFNGGNVQFDFSKIRPEGARLKTMGGKTSGPRPLQDLLNFSRSKILSRQGGRLTSLDVHDIICKIGEIVVMGGVRRCLPQNTLVHTNLGLKPIKNIRRGEKVLTYKGDYKKVIAAEFTGKKNLVEIHTQLGIFKSSLEHRWAVLDDLDGNIRWVRARDLTSKDALIHVPTNIPGRKTNLPIYEYKKPKYSTTTKDITIPELDEDMAWMIGYLHGDGYVYRKDETYGEIMFACAPDMPETPRRLLKILRRFSVLPGLRLGNENDRANRVRVKSNQLANYLYQFKRPKESITVPDFILEGAPEIRAAYISGVFDADGSVKSKNGKKVRPIVSSSVYPDWLRQLRTILASIGVSAAIKLNRPARKNWKPLYHLNVISAESFLLFGSLIYKNSEKWRNDAVNMERKKEQNSFIIPRNLLAQSSYRRLFDGAYHTPSSKVALSFSKFSRILNEHNNQTITAVSAGLKTFSLPPLFPWRLYYRPIKIAKVIIAGQDETYDIQVEEDECFVAEGMLVHNSALISLSDLDDSEMRNAKQGQFYVTEPQRAMANNSAVYNDKPSTKDFMEEWLALAQSGTGERGIFNRGSLPKQLPERRWKVFKKDFATCGTNPCGEIVLKSKEFCNLSEVIARPEDTEKTLLRKVKLATILGTYQSTLTDFDFLSKEWQQHCEEERLLGVSITGQWDCLAVRKEKILKKLKDRAIEINKKYAVKFGINPSTCITCVKPSGTVSQLVDASSGLHPRHAKFYLRRIRIAATDSLFHMLRDQKIPYFPEVGQAEGTATTYVIEFPVAAPKDSVILKDLSAFDQLEYWKKVKLNYTEHNPSVTISVGENEWLNVANWLYENWDMLGGLSFLPREEHVYVLAPYEAIDEETYKKKTVTFPEIDFSQILLYEKDDETEGSKELACVGGVCEI